MQRKEEFIAVQFWQSALFEQVAPWIVEIGEQVSWQSKEVEIDKGRSIEENERWGLLDNELF